MITTVLGDIPVDRLGPTDCHGHLLIRGGLPVALEPEFLLDSVDAAVAEAKELLAAGGDAVVDCMPLGVGRDAAGLVDTARRSGLTLVAATGFHKDRFYAADHWVRRYDADRIAELLVAEAREGMERSGYGDPYVERIEARPGIIKVATSAPEPTAMERTTLRAVGAAAAATGLPVISHTEHPDAAPAQLAALAAEGLPAERVILSHMDRHGDADTLAAACETGATVCLDWLGRTDRRPDSFVVDLVVRLVRRGHGDRVVLGQDLARRGYWHAYGGEPGMRNLFANVVPQLAAAGLSPDEVRAVLIDTPRRVLDRMEVTR
ncbi:phosphotriesterase family protein [Streptomyces boninensis]|uniref:phosphotriesterase family protein n=1 Tax=Streptomyces boninensis TaxID=2039455 RepID=UPI003B20BE04